MNATNWVRENKGLLMPVVFAVAAFGLLNTVLGSQTAERVGTVTITQVLDEDLGSMVVEARRPTNDLGSMLVEAKRPSGARVVHTDRAPTDGGRKDESALQLAVGF
jgi:hypothetical protein